MPELNRAVGLGLAARGSTSDVIEWAERARRTGLDSVWIHDSYFERDAVTYASAIASQVPDLRVALGAVNPFTRHPVLIAMTVSALDEMAPNSAFMKDLARSGDPRVPCTLLIGNTSIIPAAIFSKPPGVS